MIRNKRQKNTSKPIFKYPKYSNIRIFENSLASNLVFVGDLRSSLLEPAIQRFKMCVNCSILLYVIVSLNFFEISVHFKSDFNVFYWYKLPGEFITNFNCKMNL